LGEIDGAGTYTGGDDGGVSLDLELRGLGPGFLNPLLALVAPVQLARGQLDGRIEADTEGGEVAFGANVNGVDLVLAPTEGGRPTAPVRLTSAQKGVASWSGNVVSISQARLEVEDPARRLITASLAEPLRLTLGGAIGDAPPARIVVELDAVPLAD